MNTETMTETQTPTLHLLCGKIASGKSTLSARLSAAADCVLISEDRWLAALYGSEMRSVTDYVQYAARLRAAIKPHIVSLLQAGLSVVLDFPANTRANRAWMMSLVTESGAAHQLHYLRVADEVCKARLHARNATGDHDFSATDQQFELITRYFEEPGAEEGFRITEYA